MEYTCNELLVERVTLLRSINDHLMESNRTIDQQNNKIKNNKETKRDHTNS
jgi:hypothetical protein